MFMSIHCKTQKIDLNNSSFFINTILTLDGGVLKHGSTHMSGWEKVLKIQVFQADIGAFEDKLQLQPNPAMTLMIYTSLTASNWRDESPAQIYITQ